MNHIALHTKAEEIVRRNKYFTSTRTKALYKDFSASKQLNPEGFEANIQAWRHLIFELLQKDGLPNKLSVPPAPELAKVLAIPIYGQPMSMQLIVDELVAEKALIPLSVFFNLAGNIFHYVDPQESIFSYFTPSYWKSRGSNLVHSIRSVFVAPEGYIELNNLVAFGDELLKKIKENKGFYSNSVFDERMLYKFINGNVTSNFSARDMEILLVFLARDKKACVVKQHEDHRVVKFTDALSQQVMSEDIGIAQLRWQCSEVEDRLAWLDTKIETLTGELRNLVKTRGTKSKAMALALLKTRKLYEQQFDTCSASQHQLTEVLTKIDDATSNTVVFNALKDSAKILSELNKKIDVDELDNIKFDLATGMQQTDELSDLLGENSNQVDYDIEEEYKQMEQEANEGKEKPMDKQDDQTDEKLLERLQNLELGTGEIGAGAVQKQQSSVPAPGKSQKQKEAKNAPALILNSPEPIA